MKRKRASSTPIRPTSSSGSSSSSGNLMPLQTMTMLRSMAPLVLLISPSLNYYSQAFCFEPQICRINIKHLCRINLHGRNHPLCAPYRKQQLLITKQPHLLMTSYDNDNSDPNDNSGSILGASLLYAGTAIGAGAIALPAETVGAGFVPSTFGLVLCWIFTFVTSMVTLEASWLASTSSFSSASMYSENSVAGTDNHNSGGGDGGGFLSFSKMALGIPGEIITASLFWFLLTAIIVAYTAEGGQLISQLVQEVVASKDENVILHPAIGSLLFASFFATLANFGTASVDAINRIFVSGLVLTFVLLVGECLPLVQISNLLSHSDWTKLYPPVISIGILSLGAQNVVPTLLQYLKNDPIKTRQAIFIGSLVPLLLYLIWEAIFLGVVDASTIDGSTDVDVMSVLLGQIGGGSVSDSTIVSDLVEGFSFCAIGSSMAGASVSLVDFFQDGITIFNKYHDESSNVGQSLSGKDNSRLVATALALAPPVILAYAFPNIFLTALEEAGLLGGVSLYGILPAISILSLHHFSSDKGRGQSGIMPGRLGGGEIALIALVGVSLALVLPEIRGLLG
ncbi:hypothetical protein ACHAWU_003367 [Discostella pseudostelligera]|uniref:Tyrosine-specific transport protein n=1 Tax=Discostella pseudostelligera TaxID=259834 RepID=A0ABD3MM28_9STRA